MATNETVDVAGRRDMVIGQGTTYRHIFVYVDKSTLAVVPIDNHTARLQIRRTVGATDVLHEATTENGQLDVDGPQGQVTLEIPAADTEAWTFTAGHYDLEIISAVGRVTRLCYGKIKVTKEITR